MNPLRKFLILVAWFVALMLFASAASHAAPRHHHRHALAEAATPTFSLFQVGSDLVATARSQIGNGAIYGRRNLWCARFVNVMLAKTGHKGTGSDMAASFAKMPHTSMHVGAIAIMARRGGGHVGVVSGVTEAGDPVVISGNHGGRVREAIYPRGRVYAFVEAQ